MQIYGAEILPGSTYDVQIIHEICSGELLNETNYSLPLTVRTGEWGDIVAPFAVPGGSNGRNFLDIAAVVGKFQEAPGAPVKVRAQLQPNEPNPDAPVSFLDVSTDVGAFKGGVYPFSGPVSCP